MLDKFVEELLQEQGLPPNLDPAVRARLVKDLVTRANDLINKRVIESMDDKTLDEFNKLAEKNADQKTVHDFIENNVPNKQQIITAALLEFRQLYLGQAK
ncbi:TPA: hypothetical protein DIS56_02935 [Candidatus Saccharibacteria bacterium]|nr:MAG: hypothetical protein A3F05_04175 [Candidatus Saccharibacteria bacterium RIFCSPHIGHO2_12_FULL_47_17]HCM52061.1 hypothetical protein [Candidatus Saccharibacteria bacterium]